MVDAICHDSGLFTASFQFFSSPINYRVRSNGSLPFEWGRQNQRSLLISYRHFFTLFFLIFYGPSSFPPRRRFHAFLTVFLHELKIKGLASSTTKRAWAFFRISSDYFSILYVKSNLTNSHIVERQISTFFTLNFYTFLSRIIISLNKWERTLKMRT